MWMLFLLPPVNSCTIPSGVVYLCALTEKPAVRSSYFQQMMQDAAQSVHTAESSVTSAESSLTAGHSGGVTSDNTACQHHSNACDDTAVTSTDHPVDSSKTTQQLIG